MSADRRGTDHRCSAPRLGKEINGVVRVRQRRRQVAGGPLTAGALDRAHRVLDHLALLIFRQAIGVSGVVDTVTEEFPVALCTQRDDLRVMFTQRGRQTDRAAHTVFIEHRHLALVADPVAIITDAVTRHRGVRMRPGFAMWIGRGVEFVELDIGRHPKCETRPIGPLDFWPALVSAVIVKFELGVLGATIHIQPC